MKNTMYSEAELLVACKHIDWERDDIRCLLVTDAYLWKETDRYLVHIHKGARATACLPLTGRTFKDGIARANNLTFDKVSTSKGDITAIVIYCNSGDEHTSKLIAYIGKADNLPFTPNGQPIEVKWEQGGNGIFNTNK